MFRKLIAPAVLATAAVYAAPSQAALTLVSNCAIVGLDDILPMATQCVGYYNKNVLKSGAGSAAKADEVSALGLLGLSGSLTVLEKINNSGNFITALNGMTWIGVHYGAGQGPVNTPGGVTAFYKFDAGTNLDLFGFTNGSVSGVALYKTGGPTETINAVPEPATWALLIGGLGFTGAALRRRGTRIQFS